MEDHNSVPPENELVSIPLETPDLLTELQQENTELKSNLTHVIATASANEKIWRHFIEIERILFRTRQPDLLAEELLQEIKGRFQPDRVILFLCHPDLLERFFPGISKDCNPTGEGTWLLPLPLEAAQSLLGDPPKPFLLTPENIGVISPFLPDEASLIRSGVVIPLAVHELLFGGLLLGSLDADRYDPDAGTDLLEQLGNKIALCMENCLSYERVKDFAVQDPLTGLLNFFQVHTVLEREFRKARRLNAALSLMLIAPRFVHQFNDDLDIGNEVLRHTANLLKEILPEGESFVGRYGSDEFLVLLPNVQKEEAEEVVPYLRQTILRSPFLHQNTAILIQTLIGVGTLNEGTKRAQDIIDTAYSELSGLKMSSYEHNGE
ncbi:MAG TPA: sensor domain-containing diguanylate cyclase [Desulfomonilaceae bacterium]|nr:sensor domain-containing diguanylate cyclase [Desulfomonilaceae bacterium]